MVFSFLVLFFESTDVAYEFCHLPCGCSDPGTEKMGKSPPQPEHLATPPQVLKKIYQNERSSGSGKKNLLFIKSQMFKFLHYHNAL